jgi:hypothetical protein
MKLFFTLILILFVFHQVCAQQERLISGRLTSTEDGSALPGINITIKGTDIGTVTDANGYYSIRVPIGATLVFSFIGMKTTEVVVTENNLQPARSSRQPENIKRKKTTRAFGGLPQSLYRDSVSQDEIGVAVFTDHTPSYTNPAVINPASIKSIKKRGNTYKIKTDNDPRRFGYALQFSTSFSIDEVNKLPSVQKQYAQGRTNGSSFQWQGADQFEIFSWGPLVRTLEFDGTNYPFDKRGMLVPAGTGNGEKAKSYDVSSFFRRGLSNANELMLTLPAPKKGTWVFDVEHRTRSGVIPNSQYRKLNAGVSLKNYHLKDNLKASASISFNNSAGDLLNRGSNLASIMGGIYRTPTTFDNANGLSPKSARSSIDAFQIADGPKRSHAPGLSDNPYGLINELPDEEDSERIFATANLEYFPDSPFRINFNGSVDEQQNTTIMGVPPGYSGAPDGRLTYRKDKQTFANGTLTSSFQPNLYDGELKLSLSYQTDYSARVLNRKDAFGFGMNETFGDVDNGDVVARRNADLHRLTQQVLFNAQ